MDQIIKILKNPNHHIDYINGRPLKIGNINETWPYLFIALYDRDNGEGKMYEISQRLLKNDESLEIKNPDQKNLNDSNFIIKNLGISKSTLQEAEEIYSDLFGNLK